MEDLKLRRESKQVEQGPMSAECSEKSIPKSPAKEDRANNIDSALPYNL